MATGEVQGVQGSRRRRVSKHPKDRREDLLAAAEPIFVERGAAAATVSDVTSAAGVAKGTFYLYFASKDHVLAALRQRFVDGFVAQTRFLLEGFDTSEDWWDLALVRRSLSGRSGGRRGHERQSRQSAGARLEPPGP